MDVASEVKALQTSLPAWLARQRWFRTKRRKIISLEIIDWLPFSAGSVIVFVRIVHLDGATDIYQLTLKRDTAGDLFDATLSEDFPQGLLQLIADDAKVDLHLGGKLRAQSFDAIDGSQLLPSRVITTEQSNTSIVFGEKLMLKLYRQLQPGVMPDFEVSRFLTLEAHFQHIPRLLGEIKVELSGHDQASIAMLQEFIPNAVVGWEWAIDAATKSTGSPTPAFLEAIALLGRRTAEMHLALATETTDEAFRSEPLTTEELADEAARIRSQIGLALDALEQAIPTLHPNTVADVNTIVASRGALLTQADALLGEPPSGRIIRVHGDYHLGQVLRTVDDFVILDFEGEPAAPVAERRQKRSPLRDVAGMLRSFSYAARVYPTPPDNYPSKYLAWQDAVSTSFLNAYRQTIAARPELLPDPPLADALLHAYLLEKVCYELLYELNNRPDWVPIPVAGVLALLAYT